MKGPTKGAPRRAGLSAPPSTRPARPGAGTRAVVTLGAGSPLLGKKPRNDAEHREQAALIARVRAELRRYPALASLYAVPNETGGRGFATGQRLEAEGRSAGVFDLVLDVARPGWVQDEAAGVTFHGLRLEMKAPAGSVSREQREWWQRYRREGYAAVVCFGMEEAWAVLMDYLAGRFVQPAKITPRARS